MAQTMAKKQVDGEGLDIPDRIHALPVKRTGPVVAAVIVALLAAMLVQGLVTNPRFEWNIVWKYLFNENVLEGIGYTLLLTVISMVVAIILSVILAIMRKSINPVLRGVSWFFIWFFRGTPVYTQLVFWGLFSVLVPKLSLGIPFTSVTFWSIDSSTIITAFNAAWIGLALNEAAYLSEIVRAGLEAVDPGQTEAAKALGMKRSLIMRRIILPQAMRIIIPPTGNETIGMLKTTSLVLAVPFTLELQFATNAIANRIYKPIPLLLVACIWYLLITSILMVIQSRLEKHFGKGFEARSIVAEDNGDQQLDGPVAVSETKKDRIARGNNVKMIGLNA
jgi:polar amino acid transport system permease protein